MKERILVPALQPCIIEPIWAQFSSLLPKRGVDHPLGCHRSRIPDRTVFEKLVEILVFGCAYSRIDDESCSVTTLRLVPMFATVAAFPRAGRDSGAPPQHRRRRERVL